MIAIAEIDRREIELVLCGKAHCHLGSSKKIGLFASMVRMISTSRTRWWRKSGTTNSGADTITVKTSITNPCPR